MDFRTMELRTAMMLVFVTINVYLVQCSPVENVVSMQQSRPSYFNWKDKGVITPVRNQGMIGDPVDFTITEEVESLYAIQAKTEAFNLSVEEVAECCDDSFHQPKFHGFDCIIKIGGLCRESTYRGGTGSCNNGSCKAVGKVTKTGYIPRKREDIMMDKILITPLAAYINAGLPSFELYTGGIYSDPDCGTQLDHAVQVIGYGTSKGVDYWIIKNSWGDSWGENGYMRIARGKNMCGIAENAFYPINIE